MSETKVSKVIPEGNHKLKDKVTFVATYPKDYKGKKHLVDNKEYSLHKLHAQRLEAKGIGKVK